MSQDNLMKYVPVEVNKWGEMVQAMTRVKELEAEVARLRSGSFVTAVPAEQYDRVIKAGDTLAMIVSFDEELNGDGSIPKSVQAWHAAKEGQRI
jgi:hypothetical protein